MTIIERTTVNYLFGPSFSLKSTLHKILNQS